MNFFRTGYFGARAGASPNTPSLSLVAVVANQFQATMSNNVGIFTTLYWKRTSDDSFIQGPTVTGTSTVLITTTANASIIAYAVSYNGDCYSLPAFTTLSLAASDTISGAFVKSFKDNAVLMAACPGIWLDEVPEVDENGVQINVPYAMVEIISEVPNWQFEPHYWEEALTRLWIFANSAEEADAIVAIVKENFDWKPLPYTVSRNVWARRDEVKKGKEQYRDRNGNLVFHRIMDYSFARTQSQ